MDFPKSARQFLCRNTETEPDELTFDVVFRNKSGQEIAGIWFVRGAWRVSTDPVLGFSTKEEVLHAWETQFNHETGLPLRLSRSLVREDKRRLA